MKNKYNVKIDNVAGWPDQGLIYIDDGTEIPKGLYSFRKNDTEKGSNPVPIYISKYKNRIKLSKRILKKLEENL
jgi:hypothetical protein